MKLQYAVDADAYICWIKKDQGVDQPPSYSILTLTDNLSNLLKKTLKFEFSALGMVTNVMFNHKKLRVLLRWDNMAVTELYHRDIPLDLSQKGIPVLEFILRGVR